MQNNRSAMERERSEREEVAQWKRSGARKCLSLRLRLKITSSEEVECLAQHKVVDTHASAHDPSELRPRFSLQHQQSCGYNQNSFAKLNDQAWTPFLNW